MNGGFYGDDNEKQSQQPTKEDNEDFVDLSMLTIDYTSNSMDNSSKKRIPYIVEDDTEREPFLIKLFIFAYMWSFGGHFQGIDEDLEDIDDYFHVPNFSSNDSVNPRYLFDTFLRKLFKTKYDVKFPNCGRLMFSYYVDFHKGQFMLWDHLLLSTTMYAEKTLMDNAMETGGIDSVFGSKKLDASVPTSSSICYSFLISLLALHNVPVLLAGASGVGKTTLISDILKRLSDPGGSTISTNSILGSVLSETTNKISGMGLGMQDIQPRKVSIDYNDVIITSSLAFTALTDATKPKNALQSKLVKRGRDAFGTPHGERVRFYVPCLIHMNYINSLYYHDFQDNGKMKRRRKSLKFSFNH